MQVTSPHNPLVQDIRRASRLGKPTKEGHIVVEGPHLVGEALQSLWGIETIVTTRSGLERYADLVDASSAEIVEASERAFSAISATATTQGILAVLRQRKWAWNHLANGSILIVVLDGVQDPGNAGTIVRSAEAFGATGVVFLKSSVRVANGKFLRATAGSIFRMPYLEDLTALELSDLTDEFRITKYALTPRASTSLLEADLQQACALVVGSEGGGVSEELLNGARAISIPTGNVESLNAGIACSIALYEARRQRQAHESV